MGQRIGGIAYLKWNGRQLALKGNFQVSPSATKRTGVAGQDGVHGYTEMPVVPSIQGDISLTADTSVEELDAIEDATVTAELANGKTYVLREAWTESSHVIDTAEGKIAIKFEGVSCDEF